jgi:colicin import membrane protein
MKREINHAYVDRYLEVRSDSRSVTFFFGISIFLHLILIGTLMVMPKITSRPRFAAGVVNVSLVSLPERAPGEGSGNQTIAQPKPEIKEPQKAAVSEIPLPPKTAPIPPKPAEKVSLAPKPKPKPKVKTSLKKETLDRSKVIEHAIDRIQKKVDESETESVKNAIDRLKKKVEETEAAAPQRYGLGKGNSGVGEPGFAEAGGGGPQAIEAIKIYQAEIQYRIQKNWAFSQQLAGDITDLETVLAIKILRDGEIEDIWFDKKSGNDYLDDSAYKAIVKSNPLPPLPKEFSGPQYEIGLIFGPKGLK